MSELCKTEKNHTTEIRFNSTKAEHTATITLTAGNTELVTSPEKVKEIARLLDFPEGATITLNVTASTTIVR